MRLHFNFIDLVTSTIDHMVKDNGLPVISTVLTESGLATRAQLRKLVNMDKLVVTTVRAGGALVNAYYTKEVIPDAIRRQQAKRDEARRTSEELQGRLCTIEEAEAVYDAIEAERLIYDHSEDEEGGHASIKASGEVVQYTENSDTEGDGCSEGSEGDS